MVNLVTPEVNDVAEEEAPQKKRGRPAAKKPNSVTVKLKNVSNVDLPLPGDLIKSGTTKSYPAHIGHALQQSATVQNYIRLNQIKVL
jgi:hypothetical protein